MQIDLYVFHYNEEQKVKLVTDYWRLLPLRRIFVIDNLSTDGSLDYIKRNFDNVEVIINDSKDNDNLVRRDLRRTVWKRSVGKCDFVIVSDFDEVLYAPDILQQLQFMKKNNYTVLEPTPISTICTDDNFPSGDKLIHEDDKVLFYPLPEEFGAKFNKKILFDPNRIQEMRYNSGGHGVKVVGIDKVYSGLIYLLHINNLGLNNMIAKFSRMSARNSAYNAKTNESWQYKASVEQQTKWFEENLAKGRSWEEAIRN